MEFFNFLKLGLRHKILLIIFFAIGVFFTVFLSFKFTPPYKAVLFTTIIPLSSESDDFDYDQFYTTRSSENFSETFAGWTKNPVVVDKIQKKSGIDTANTLSARFEKKGNVVLSVKAKTEKEAKKLAEATKVVLKEELDEYNNIEKRFSIKDFDVKLKWQKIIFFSLIIGGAILSLFMSVVCAYFVELIFGKIIFNDDVKNVFGDRVKIMSVNLFGLKQKSRLKNILKHLLNSKNNLIFIGSDFSDFDLKLSEKQKKEILFFPKNNIKFVDDKNNIIFIKLGKTNLLDLKLFNLKIEGNLTVISF